MALDNLPGALVYTDEDLKKVFCNERFKEMYPAPRELLQSGRPYPDFLRFLAENGHYGAGDVDAMVAQRVDSLRNLTSKSFEDRTPDGRCYHLLEKGLNVSQHKAAEGRHRFHRAIERSAGHLRRATRNLDQKPR